MKTQWQTIMKPARERRTMFVGMTRALLVVVPANSTSPLLEGFDPTYWDFNRVI